MYAHATPFAAASIGLFANKMPLKQQSFLRLEMRGDEGYEQFSRHIAKVFKQNYGAKITVAYPLLMGFVDCNNEPISAIGIRYAIMESPLFLERYLDEPAEIILQNITGKKISRRDIAEAGNLASSGNGDILRLLYALACHLEGVGMEYILFTGTSLLRRYLNSLGLYPHILAEAKAERAGENAANWGTYYDTRPKVMAGNVNEFRTGLEAYFANLDANGKLVLQ